MTKVIKTAEELICMRGEGGVIIVDGDMKVECDVPYSVGKEIAGLNVSGDLDARGNLNVRGDLCVLGDLNARGDLDVSGYLHALSNLNVRGDLDVSGYLNVRGDLCVLGDLNARGKYAVIMGDLFWSHASMPKLPQQHYIRRVLPQVWQRDHWQERLGMDISSGCYDEICRNVLEQIHILLRNEKWTPTERWMLETLRDSCKGAPEWVAEVSKQKNAEAEPA